MRNTSRPQLGFLFDTKPNRYDWIEYFNQIGLFQWTHSYYTENRFIVKHIKKTEEDIRKEWEKDAENKAKSQLILSKIAQVEKLTPDETAVSEQVKQLMEHYKDADELNTRAYVTMVLTNEKVFDFLEG